MRDGGEPEFFVLLALEDGRLAIGCLGTDYIRQVQRAIAFGERGHSMIVDRTGRVVAHLNAKWEASSKDASKVSVVAKMMRGETGVATFFSPPMQADMIAGHTVVPEVGWGVMVPQPPAEMVKRARRAGRGNRYVGVRHPGRPRHRVMVGKVSGAAHGPRCQRRGRDRDGKVGHPSAITRGRDPA